jgi:hypothetical protein
VDEGTNIDDYLRISQGSDDEIPADATGSGGEDEDSVVSLETAGADPEFVLSELLGQSVLVGGDSDSDDATEAEGILIDQDNLDRSAE